MKVSDTIGKALRAAGAATKVPDIPDVPDSAGPLRDILTSMREILQVREGRRGQGLDAGVTFRDLTDSGIALVDTTVAKSTTTVKTPIKPAPSTSTLVVDDRAPPVLSGVIANGGYATAFLGWPDGTYSEGGGHAGVQVWAAAYDTVAGGPLPTFAAATQIDYVVGTAYANPVGQDKQLHFWLFNVANNGKRSVSPAGGVNGFQINTSAANGTAQALIDTAIIGELTAAKATLGTVGVGRDIKSTNYIAGASGFRLSYTGSIEASDAVIRGTIYASQGAIGGINIGSGSIYSSNVSAAGNGQGFSFQSDGYGRIGGIGFGPTYLASNNYIPNVAGFALFNSGVAQFENAVLIRGQITNPSTGNYINLGATGSQDLLNAGGGKVRITADGNAYLLGNQGTGTWTGSVPVVWMENVVTGYVNGDGTIDPVYASVQRNGAAFYIDTGVNIQRGTLDQRSFTARVWAATAAWTKSSGLPAPGAYAYGLMIEPTVVQRASLYAFGASSTGGPYGPFIERIYIRVRIEAIDNLIDTTAINLTSLSWTLDAIS